MLPSVAKMVTMAKMTKKPATSKSEEPTGKHPNGLAEAIAKLNEPIGPTALAKEVGSTKQTIDRYLKWERKLPKQMAAKIAPLVKSTAAELLQVETDLPAFERVPLLSWVSAGHLAWQEGISNVDMKKHVITADLPKGKWVALTVEGNSMDRIAPSGATIFVDTSDNRLKEDRYYVFSAESGEATFKRYRAGSPPRLQPFSTDPDQETIPAPEGMKVLGRVRRVVTDLK